MGIKITGSPPNKGRYKKFAEGSGTLDFNGAITVNGLLFNPSRIALYQAVYEANSKLLIVFSVIPGDIVYSGVANSTNLSGQRTAAGVDTVSPIAAFSAGVGTFNMQFTATFASLGIKWKAFE